LSDLSEIISLPIIGITDKRTPLRFFCVYLLLSAMSYSHISGYDLPNDRLRSVMRTETGPKLLAKDKLIEFKPTQTESFFKSTMSLLDKFDMLDMIEPDLWKWIPRSEIPSLIEKSQNSIQSNLGNVQFSSKAMKRDYTTQLFEIRENSSSSNSSYVHWQVHQPRAAPKVHLCHPF
jgi:hypothetical protein